MNPERLEAAYQTALAALLKERMPEGHWVGELSTSALSTATAVMALHSCSPRPFSGEGATCAHRPSGGEGLGVRGLIDGGLRWLAEHQNDDGGWGDTTKSFSNISTTMLCRAAFHLTGAASRFALVVNRAETWLFSKYGNTAEKLAEAVRARYGKDRTFATPILTTCALAGLVDWKEVPPLPFELAIFPQSWFRFLRLHVVSYALPALIAIGQCIYHHKKPWNPMTRFVRWLSRGRTLKVLERIQPTSGGFLEAIPLTSFVVLSLAACGLAQHPVATSGIAFLIKSVRPDGSWPIDSNLATWVTTLSVNALATAGDLEALPKKDELKEWLLKQQYRERHPYTGAAPGGWAWTPLPGGVPDADDTAGSLISLGYLKGLNALDACLWLLGIQNRDGGWPTFCRGWGRLPFDRSGPDLTAHALRALAESGKFWLGDDVVPVLWEARESFIDWTEESKQEQKLFWKLESAFRRAETFLAGTQRPDGTWLPLWFGNQHAPNDENPTYGTARVLAAYRDLGMMNEEPARRGVTWLLAAQNPDGGWGGAKDCLSSVEETALAVEILLDVAQPPFSGEPEATAAVNKGLAWLVEQVESGGLDNPSPIGFYFAKLWYYEKLYPIIFSVAALGRARQRLPVAPR